MISLSASGLRPTFTSVSIPRFPKISTARGLSASAISTLVMENCPKYGNGRRGSGRCRAADLAIGPVEPRQQRLDVAALDGGTCPDPQARRRVAVAGDVVRDTFRIE